MAYIVSSANDYLGKGMANIPQASHAVINPRAKGKGPWNSKVLSSFALKSKDRKHKVNLGYVLDLLRRNIVLINQVTSGTGRNIEDDRDEIATILRAVFTQGLPQTRLSNIAGIYTEYLMSEAAYNSCLVTANGGVCDYDTLEKGFSPQDIGGVSLAELPFALDMNEIQRGETPVSPSQPGTLYKCFTRQISALPRYVSPRPPSTT